MKRYMKILLSVGLLFLIIGTVSAFDVDSLKPISDCNSFSEGCSTYTTYGDRYFMVESMPYDLDSIVDEWFTNDTKLKYFVKPVGDNIYFFESEDFVAYGYQEIVTLDGTYYMVSVNQPTKLSPSEEKELLEDLKEFNKLNNLEPIAI